MRQCRWYLVLRVAFPRKSNFYGKLPFTLSELRCGMQACNDVANQLFLPSCSHTWHWSPPCLHLGTTLNAGGPVDECGYHTGCKICFSILPTAQSLGQYHKLSRRCAVSRKNQPQKWFGVFSLNHASSMVFRAITAFLKPFLCPPLFRKDWSARMHVAVANEVAQ